MEQLLYPCVVEVCRLGLEPLCDIHLHLSVILKTLTLTEQEFSGGVRKDENRWAQDPGYRVDD